MLTAVLREGGRYNRESIHVSCWICLGFYLVRLFLCSPASTASRPERSLASAFAQNSQTFITFVALQGLGAAANTPAGDSCCALSM